MKVKLLTDKEREEMDGEIFIAGRTRKRSPKQPMAASTPKSAKRRNSSGQGSQTQSQARDNEGCGIFSNSF